MSDEPLCQFIMYHKRVERGTFRPIDPPIPVRCLRPEVVPYEHAWTPHVGQLGHTFQRFTEVHRWTI